MNQPSKFTHLHVHSEYSLLDGLTKFGPMLDTVKELGMDSVALTDHGGMYGAIKFYTKAKAYGIKPIIGVETYIAKRRRFDKDPKLDNDQYHVLLLAKNEKGYKNLLQLVSKSYLEGYYYKPRVDFDLLQEYSKDIIALSGCLSGIGSYYFKIGEDKKAKEGLSKLSDIFQDNFYIELQRHKNLPEQDIVNEKLLAFAKEKGLPIVATADSHYTNVDDAEAQEVLLCIQTQRLLEDPSRSLSMIKEPDFYIKSAEEMKALFLDLPEAIENTQRIADQIDIQLKLGKLIFPRFPLPDGVTPAQYLRDEVYKRVHRRFSEITKEIKDRIEFELSIIEDKAYPAYFLIVADFTNWAKEQGIGVGPGRGSAAGSLVSYIMGITNLNPLEHNLPFERFLNPERASPPDIDMDFGDDRREEVIDYVTKKYGDDKVAQIITFGTMEAKAAIRDTGRVLGMSYAECDRIAKLIPPGSQATHMNIDWAMELVPDLKTAYDTEPQTKRLIDLAKRLEGVARHSSVHAAGVVISDKPLVDYTPLQKEAKGERVITQYDMYSLDLNISDDAVGLMKMDFLGLRNLTILQKANEFIKTHHGKPVDLDTLPLDDKKVFDIISSGNTTGIFQIESSGMRRLARDLRPSAFSDISAMIALFRPGPMDLIPDFIAGKQNRSTVKYPHPALKPILEETYGVAVYQEQCMQIAVTFAGYTMGAADGLRRAIGKKKISLMEKEKKKFTEGAVKQGHTKEEAHAIFALLEKFVGYGFNKAHAASYAMITYQTGYMKAHFPVEFMAAVLSSEALAKAAGSQKEEKVSEIVSECKTMGITILPPNINKSLSDFAIEKLDGERGSIRFGLAAVKNVGETAVQTILKEREIGGDFADLADFLRRVDTEKANKRVVESLIKTGAFDQYGNRKVLLYQLDQILDNINKQKRVSLKYQNTLFATEEFSVIDLSVVNIPEDLGDFTKLELLRFEKELLGYYLADDAMFSEFAPFVDTLTTHKIINFFENQLDSQRVVVLGIITAIRKTITKASQAEMAFVKIEDETGEIECVVFPKTYALVKTLIAPNQPIVMSGKVDTREDTPSLIVDQLATPEEAKHVIIVKKDMPSQYPRKDGHNGNESTKPISGKKKDQYELFVKKGTKREQLEQAHELLQRYPGTISLVVAIENRSAIRKITYPKPIDLNDELKAQLEKILGPNCIRTA